MGNKCNHEFEIDEFFANGGVMMFSGKIGEVKKEIRMICKKCGEVDYKPDYALK